MAAVQTDKIDPSNLICWLMFLSCLSLGVTHYIYWLVWLCVAHSLVLTALWEGDRWVLKDVPVWKRVITIFLYNMNVHQTSNQNKEHGCSDHKHRVWHHSLLRTPLLCYTFTCWLLYYVYNLSFLSSVPVEVRFKLRLMIHCFLNDCDCFIEGHATWSGATDEGAEAS